MVQHFIGVYATQEKMPVMSEFPRPVGKRKRLWFVWETPEGKYKVQPLNAVYRPMGEARVITGREFDSRFTAEPDCAAVPEGYAPPKGHAPPGATPLDAAFSSLPDLFMRDADPAGEPSGPGAAPERPAEGGALQADDPNLLMAWAKSEPPRKHGSDPAKIPFDRLVSEVVETPGGLAAPAGERPAQPEGAGSGEDARLLRSRFVQALLLLRRGEKAEATALLQDMLFRSYTPFEGGAQLFSEFGLGLRRLGLTPLALAAHKLALEFSPHDARVLFNIARSYHDLHLVAEAKEFLAMALEADPDFAAARQFLTFLEAGNAEPAKKQP
ncbi:MAG: hypothetical protein LBV01_04885 [Deltaproteobacteria bacterium]|nr:hypothetical protein [Deltaproteobacteria bacterium]